MTQNKTRTMLAAMVLCFCLAFGIPLYFGHLFRIVDDTLKAIPPQPEETIPISAAPKRNFQSEFAEYMNTLNSVPEKDGMKISDLILPPRLGKGDDELIVTFTNIYMMLPHNKRLEGAKTFWLLWAGIHAPKDPRRARVVFLDSRGETVGGSVGEDGSNIEISL
jgi:hypothetical protein